MADAGARAATQVARPHIIYIYIGATVIYIFMYSDMDVSGERLWSTRDNTDVGFAKRRLALHRQRLLLLGQRAGGREGRAGGAGQ